MFSVFGMRFWNVSASLAGSRLERSGSLEGLSGRGTGRLRGLEGSNLGRRPGAARAVPARRVRRKVGACIMDR